MAYELELQKYEKELPCYNLVTTHLIHGPCGEENPRSPCMREGQCRFKYIKDFCGATTAVKSEEDSIGAGHRAFIYKIRRPWGPANPVPGCRNGEFIRVLRGGRRICIDNRYFAQHNASLLINYGAHIKVELVASTMVVRFSFKQIKYVLKGHERQSVTIETEQTASSTAVVQSESSSKLSC